MEEEEASCRVWEMLWGRGEKWREAWAVCWRVGGAEWGGRQQTQGWEGNVGANRKWNGEEFEPEGLPLLCIPSCLPSLERPFTSSHSSAPHQSLRHVHCWCSAFPLILKHLNQKVITQMRCLGVANDKKQVCKLLSVWLTSNTPGMCGNITTQTS